MDAPEPTAASDMVADTTVGGMWTRPDVIGRWLQQQSIDVCPPVTVERVGIGQSNITTIVRDTARHEWVLREPPAAVTTANAHDVIREAHILRALEPTDVPVPGVVGTGTSTTGSPFLIMTRAPGSPLESENDARTLPHTQRYALGISVAETLGRLHRLDPAHLGVPTSTTPYLVRQLRRIAASWQRVREGSRHDRAWQEVFTGLQRRRPQPPTPVVMHGDYRLSNLLVSEGQQARRLRSLPHRGAGRFGVAVVAVCGGWADRGGVRRGRPRFICGACEPVGQHGGGGLPREPWIGAIEPERQTSEFSLPSPRRTPLVRLRGGRWDGSGAPALCGDGCVEEGRQGLRASRRRGAPQDRRDRDDVVLDDLLDPGVT